MCENFSSRNSNQKLEFDNETKSEYSRINESDNSNKFPNFMALNEAERLIFFEALNSAKENVKKSGIPVRQQFGTIHDEFFQCLNTENSVQIPEEENKAMSSSSSLTTQATYTLSLPSVKMKNSASWLSIIDPPAESASEDMFLLNNSSDYISIATISEEDFDYQKSHESNKSEINISKDESFNQSLIERKINSYSKIIETQTWLEYESKILKDADNIVDLYSKKKKFLHDDKIKYRKENKNSDNFKYDNVKEKWKEKKYSDTYIKYKKPEKSNPLNNKNPRFDALTNKEREIFFKILKDAHRNVMEKNPEKRNEIVPLDWILNRYLVTNAEIIKVTQINPSNKYTEKLNNGNVNINVTIKSADNERLNFEALEREKSLGQLKSSGIVQKVESQEKTDIEEEKESVKDITHTSDGNISKNLEKELPPTPPVSTEPKVEIKENQDENKKVIPDENKNDSITNTVEQKEIDANNDLTSSKEELDLEIEYDDKKKRKKIQKQKKAADYDGYKNKKKNKNKKKKIKEHSETYTFSKCERKVSNTSNVEHRTLEEYLKQSSLLAHANEKKLLNKNVESSSSSVKVEKKGSLTSIDPKKIEEESKNQTEIKPLAKTESIQKRSISDTKIKDKPSGSKTVLFKSNDNLTNKSKNVSKTDILKVNDSSTISKNTGSSLKDIKSENQSKMKPNEDKSNGGMDKKESKNLENENNEKETNKKEKSSKISLNTIRKKLSSHLSISKHKIIKKNSSSRVSIMEKKKIIKINSNEIDDPKKENGTKVEADNLSKILSSLQKLQKDKQKEKIIHVHSVHTFPNVKEKKTESLDKSLKTEDSIENTDNTDGTSKTERKSKSVSSLNLSDQDPSITLERENLTAHSGTILEEKMENRSESYKTEVSVKSSTTESIDGEEENLVHQESYNKLFVPMFIKKRKLPPTKVRLLQDLLKDRAGFVEGSMLNYKIVKLPEPKETFEPQTGRFHLEETEDTNVEKGKKFKFVKFLAKICRCGKKETGEDNNFLDNLKGEAVTVDLLGGSKVPASVTLNDSTMEVLKAAERKKIIQKYWKTD